MLLRMLSAGGGTTIKDRLSLMVGTVYRMVQGCYTPMELVLSVVEMSVGGQTLAQVRRPPAISSIGLSTQGSGADLEPRPACAARAQRFAMGLQRPSCPPRHRARGAGQGRPGGLGPGGLAGPARGIGMHAARALFFCFAKLLRFDLNI